MAKQKQDHVHKLRRHRYSSGNIIYFCALPDCSYKITPPLALGKKALCWRCGEPFILSEYSIRLAKPHCENCHKPKGSDSTLSERIAETLSSEVGEVTMTPVLSAVKSNTVSDLRSRLSSVLHPKPFSVEEIDEDI